ncbi:MAG: polysaccharide biosynthesis protein [Campylobacterales bacterium]|nr:polysaccharide biosynthesis protein [Campylobacterales bacterium]
MSVSFFRPTLVKRFLFFVLADVVLSLITFYLSYDLRFNFEIPSEFFDAFLPLFIILVSLKIGSLYFFNIYSIPWRYFSLDSLEKIVKAHIGAYFLFLAVFSIGGDYLEPFPRSVIVIDAFLSLVFLGLLRISKRFFLESRNKTGSTAIIIGTDRDAEIVARYLSNHNSDIYPVAFIEDDPNRIGSTIFNLRVFGFEHLAQLIGEYGVHTAVIAKELEPKKLNELFNILKLAGIENIKMVSIFKDGAKEKLKELSIEDLLARKPKDLDKKAIDNFISNKTVLITGAGGSIGRELVKQVINHGALSLILVDNSEVSIYNLSNQYTTHNNITIKLASVLDLKTMEEIFKNHKPDIVLHAAAFKHVPIVEENPLYACENNIIGTKNAIDLAVKYKAEKFVLISTDKAVRPTNIMGATKRVCELYAGNIESNETKIVSVRFGNVLGSSGSVVPRFKEQIEQGGPITVTHPEVTRFFMLVNEACQLVLQAASLGEGGEIFILDMGKPVKIVDLANKMIQIYNKPEVGIEFVGLRSGEKLYEELLIDENDRKTEYESIFVAPKSEYNIQQLKEQIERLLTTKEEVKVLQEIIPEFTHQPR